jgi:hypothetical protein
MPIERQAIDDILTDLFFRYEDALAKSDLVKLEEFFESEIKFIKIGMKGQRQGLDALRAHHMQLFERSHSGAEVCFRETISLKVMSFGEDAGITQSEFIDDFLPLDCRGFQTLVWQKVLSEWKLISVHESVEVDVRDLIIKRNQGSSSMNRTRSGRRN